MKIENSTSILFSPYVSGALRLRNRIVMAPMTRNRADNPELAATTLIAEYYAQRASAGLLISEGTFVSPRAAGYIHVPGIYSVAQTEGWKLTTKAVHEQGGKIFAQLWHTGRISHPDFHGGALPLAPSAINPHTKSFTPEGFKTTVTPKAMGPDDIQQTILDFRNASKNAMEAGFDGIELHAANGYLFHQFFVSCANQRTDQYGGSIENRSRFLFEVLDAVAEVMDLKRVGVRLNPTLDGSFGITTDETTEPVFDYIAARLNDYPLVYLHLSGFSKSVVNEKSMDAILATARHYRGIYKGTLMINKGFDAVTAAKALEEGVTDLVSFGEPFIANPDLVARFKQNASLNKGNRETYYTTGAKGYTDYPFLGA